MPRFPCGPPAGVHIDASEPIRLRLAALSDYDRGEWVEPGSYEPVGTTVPDADNGRAASTSLTVTVETDQLQGPWLPLPGRIEGITQTSAPLLVDQQDQSVITSTTTAGSATTAEVTSAVLRTPSANILLTSEPASDARAFARPIAGTPPALTTLATQVVGTDGSPPFVKLGRLQQFFRSHFSVDPKAPAGHSLEQIATFLGAGHGTGTTEQFATAFVVLARAIGLPARVAVGYVLPAGQLTRKLVTGDLQAWPEVALQSLQGAPLGWVALDPVPSNDSTTNAPDPKPMGAAAQAASRIASDPNSTLKAASSVLGSSRGGGGLPTWLLTLILALAVVLIVPPATVALREFRWRSRWRGQSPERRVAGAWLSVRRSLLRSGVPVPLHATTHDVEQLAAARLTTEQTPALNQLADRQRLAVFAPPGNITDDVATQSWTDAGTLSRSLLKQTNRSLRLRLRYGLTAAAWR